MSSLTSHRILIADAQPIVRAGLAAILSRHPDMQVVGQASDGQEAICLFHTLRPDVLVMEVKFRDLSGKEVIDKLMNRFPNTNILVLSHHEEEEYIYRALQAGAKGYHYKVADPEALVTAVRLVCKGHQTLAASVTLKMVQRMRAKELTPRELEVLDRLVAGNSNQEIGILLCIAEGTVKVHVANILQKLGVCDRTQAAVAAISRGLVPL